MRVDLHIIEEEMIREFIVFNKAKIGTCGSGMVTTFEELWKRLGKNPKDGHKDDHKKKENTYLNKIDKKDWNYLLYRRALIWLW